jgi:hypothetical protein
MFTTRCWQVAGLILMAGVIALAQRNEVTRGTEVNVVKKTMKVAGATLYYEVRGSGPVLLMIPGGPADSDVFAGIAPMLAERYTVVTYDPRGDSRSPLDGTPEAWWAEVHADDASLLLAAVGSRHPSSAAAAARWSGSPSPCATRTVFTRSSRTNRP